jgi:hypothetical protein
MKGIKCMRAASIVARLSDCDGYSITEEEHATRREAKERCKYLLSDSYAESAETSHEALGTYGVEVLVNGECVWEKLRDPGYSAWNCVWCGRKNIPVLTEYPDAEDLDDPPAQSDDAAWAKFQELHRPGCRWVRSRGFQLEDLSTC